jgi:hypothetical protein
MKNIHILPTDNEQHSIIQKHTGLLLKQTKEKHFSGNKMNLYITSDEEIKDGDWILEISDNSIFTIQIQPNTNLSKYKKIILTTDQDLIKDGVQSIDDEFLEWFVKNPSCEEIEVNKIYNDYEETNIFDLVCTSHSFIYKIIIPQEKLKQEETLEEVAQWVIDNRYAKSELEKVSDFEMYNIIIDKCSKWQQEQDRWKTVFEEIPPSNIELLAESPSGIIHLTDWRAGYQIFSCQVKSESSDDWKWKTI